MSLKPLLQHATVFMNGWFSLLAKQMCYPLSKSYWTVFFSNILDENLLVYLDNLLIFSTNVKLYYYDVCKTMEWLNENNLKVKVI